MNKITFCLLNLILPFIAQAQISTVNFIDTSIPTAGITKILSNDLNNDGFNDIITSTTGNNGRIGYYTNLTNNTFSNFNLIENFEFCRGIASGKLNNDNNLDFVAIGKSTNEVKVFVNNIGTYSTSIIDTNTLILNDVIVANFDNVNFDDIIIIGQHSIDFYRNNGNATFTKEIILSTNTSPVVLECLDIEAKDIDNDGDLDIISGETAGLVVYFNNGNGIFTPNYYSNTTEVFFIVHSFDIDNDNDYDIIGRNGSGQVKWFSNNGSGIMTYQTTLASVPNLIAIDSNDYNGDGWQDLFVSYTNNIAIIANDASHTFTNLINVHQNTNLIMGKVASVNINNNGGLDYVWSGWNNTLAFHLNQALLSVDKNNSNTIYCYPNPTSGNIRISEPIERIALYSIFGIKLKEFNNTNSIDISNFPAAIYILQIQKEGKINYEKIIKN